MASKRSNDESIDSEAKKQKSKEKCFFGEKCYRRNPQHFKEFSHPHIESLTKEPIDANSSVLKDQWNIIKELNLLHVPSETAGNSSENPTQGSDKSDPGPKVKHHEKEYMNVRKEKAGGSIDIKNVKNSPVNPNSSKSSLQGSESEHEEEITNGTNDEKCYKQNNDTKLHPLLRRFENAQPYNMFFTKVKDIPSTHNNRNSIYFTELFHACHGNLRRTVQINFLVDYDFVR